MFVFWPSSLNSKYKQGLRSTKRHRRLRGNPETMPKTKSPSKHQRKYKEKLKKYVEKDDFDRLTSYLRKHRKDVDINLLQFEGGDRLLHLVCEKGQDHTAWYLIKKGADPMTQNDQGEVPLHCACSFVLSESHYGYYDLVQPLIDKCPRAMDVADNKGRTPRMLVKRIRQHLADKGATVQEDSSSSSEQSDQEDWEARLKGEMEDEYSQQWGTYEQDFVDHNETFEPREPYWAWAQRIQEELRRKRQHEFEQKNPELMKRRKQKEEEAARAKEQAEFQRKLEREHAEYQKRAVENRKQKIIQEKAKYELRCTEVFKKGTSVLSYRDIPWPTPTKWDKAADSLKEFLLCDIDVKDLPLVRKTLKSQQVQWHPDRFQQKIGRRLKSEDSDRIMDRVKLISQILNNIISELDS